MSYTPTLKGILALSLPLHQCLTRDRHCPLELILSFACLSNIPPVFAFFFLSPQSAGPHSAITAQPVTVPSVAVVADIVHWILSTYFWLVS